MKSPLKWCGGKGFLLPRLQELYAPHRHRRLVEPFMGACTVALGLDPDRALLADSNIHLVNFFARLRVPRPMTLPMNHDEVTYYSHRNRFNALIKGDGKFSHEAAELFYYLNRSCFNGVCRFNQSGEYNVPMGKYKTVNYQRDLSAYSTAFSRWSLVHSQFDELTLQPDDFVFVDPPYDSDFTTYDGVKFTWEDQVLLTMWLADHPGPIVATNQATDRILALYRNAGYKVDTAKAPRSVSAKGDREPALEMIATRNF